MFYTCFSVWIPSKFCSVRFKFWASFIGDSNDNVWKTIKIQKVVPTKRVLLHCLFEESFFVLSAEMGFVFSLKVCIKATFLIPNCLQITKGVCYMYICTLIVLFVYFCAAWTEFTQERNYGRVTRTSPDIDSSRGRPWGWEWGHTIQFQFVRVHY